MNDQPQISEMNKSLLVTVSIFNRYLSEVPSFKSLRCNEFGEQWGA